MIENYSCCHWYSAPRLNRIFILSPFCVCSVCWWEWACGATGFSASQELSTLCDIFWWSGCFMSSKIRPRSKYWRFFFLIKIHKSHIYGNMNFFFTWLLFLQVADTSTARPMCVLLGFFQYLYSLYRSMDIVLMILFLPVVYYSMSS